MGGTSHTPSAGMLRAAAAVAEPFYSGIMRARNRLYDRGIFGARALGRPAVSVGNITTGGTGKTPVVQWICRQLMAEGKKPAILMRGYRKNSGNISDEEAIFHGEQIPVVADADRSRGAAIALERFPGTDLFILDDALQHRSAARDFELTIIHAAEPFGYRRVFPRGLLREPMAGLRRADAFVITHADEADPAAVIRTLARFNPSAPVFKCNHVIEAELTSKRFFAFCGIGSPASFFWRLGTLGGTSAGEMAFDDHHDYTTADIEQINAEAQLASADLLVTTAKDWVKLEKFADQFAMPVMRAELTVQFHPGDGERLMKMIHQGIGG
jgi:tetraacyldisaccharide 4'-kinase